MVKIPEDAFDNGLGLRVLPHDSFLFQRHEPDGRVVRGVFLAIIDFTGEFDPRVGQLVRFTRQANEHHDSLIISGRVSDLDSLNRYDRHISGMWLAGVYGAWTEYDEMTAQSIFGSPITQPQARLQ